MIIGLLLVLAILAIAWATVWSLSPNAPVASPTTQAEDEQYEQQATFLTWDGVEFGPWLLHKPTRTVHHQQQ